MKKIKNAKTKTKTKTKTKNNQIFLTQKMDKILNFKDITSEILFDIFKQYDKQQEDFCDLYSGNGSGDNSIDGYDDISYYFKLFKLFENPHFQNPEFMNFEKLIPLICEKIIIIPKHDEKTISFECRNISITKWKNYDVLLNDPDVKYLECEFYSDVSILMGDFRMEKHKKLNSDNLKNLLYNIMVNNDTVFKVMDIYFKCFQKHNFCNTDLKSWNEVKFYIGVHVSDGDILIAKVIECIQVFEKLFVQKRIDIIPTHIKRITTYNQMFYIPEGIEIFIQQLIEKNTKQKEEE